MNLGEWPPVTASFRASLHNDHHHNPHFLRTGLAETEYDFGLIAIRLMQALGLVEVSSTADRNRKAFRRLSDNYIRDRGLAGYWETTTGFIQPHSGTSR